MKHYFFNISLRELRGNLEHLSKKLLSPKGKVSLNNEKKLNGIDNILEDLPLTLSKDPEPGVKYYTTENSEFSRGKESTLPMGKDSFGEPDTFDFEEADDYQTNRDRNQNSDLSKRFYTNGLDFDQLNS